MPGWILLVFLLYATASHAAAVGSGRNWRLQLDGIECEGSLLAIATRVRYLAPSGAVEAPVSRLVDGAGKRYPPKSLVWRSGSKALAELLSSGGLRNIETQSSAGIEFRFQAAAELKLEFGDVGAFHLSRKRNSACEYEIRAPKGHARGQDAKLDFPVHRGRYPCTPSSIIEAEYPPYLPRQLLLFGRGYLPNAREIDLPMGWASAQSYFYVGADDVIAVENAARRALAADFPEYGSSARYFAFNWGTQKAESGNDMYSIGVYELRACPK